MPAETEPELAKVPELSPLEKLLATIPNAPSPEKIAVWKSEVPGNRLKVFSPDGKRIFYLRGVGGLELSKIQESIPANASNPDREVMFGVVSRAVKWTNIPNFDEMTLRNGPAGLPDSLFALIQNLSDFYEPVQLFNFSMEL